MPVFFRLSCALFAALLLVGCGTKHSPEAPGLGSGLIEDGERRTGPLYGRTLPEFLGELGRVTPGMTFVELEAMRLAGDGSGAVNLPLQDLMKERYPYQSTNDWRSLLPKAVLDECTNGWMGECRALSLRGEHQKSRQLANLFAYMGRCDDHEFRLDSSIHAIIFLDRNGSVLVPPYIGEQRVESPSEDQETRDLCFLPDLLLGAAEKGLVEGGADAAKTAIFP